MNSKFLRLNTRDLIRGMIVTILCTLLTGVYQLLAGGFTINRATLRPVVIAAIGAGISYLTKNLLTNSKGEFMSYEPAILPDES